MPGKWATWEKTVGIDRQWQDGYFAAPRMPSTARVRAGPRREGQVNAKIMMSVATMLFLLGADDPRLEEDHWKDFLPVQGVWRVVAFERNGKTSTSARTKNNFVVIKYDQVAIFADRICMRYWLPAVSLWTLTLDPTKTPGEFDLIGQGRLLGIYSLEKDTLKIGLSQGHGRPKQFSSNDDQALLLVLKREVAINLVAPSDSEP